jgi:hypothetical protein
MRKLPAASMSIEKAAASLAGPRPAKTSPVTAPSGMVCNKRPGKEVPTVYKQAGASHRSPAARRPSPKLPVAKPTTVQPPPEVELPSTSGTNSRTALEKLVEETSEELSQMSRMKKMSENDDESQAVDAIVSQLAKNPISNGLSKLQTPNRTLTTCQHWGCYLMTFFCIAASTVTN